MSKNQFQATWFYDHMILFLKNPGQGGIYLNIFRFWSKILKFWNFKILYSGANLCTGGTTNLFTATCDSSGFVITVDETCRAASYNFIDWAGGAFLYGDATKQTKAAVYVMDKNIFWLRQILNNSAIFLSIWIYALSCS